MSKNLGLVLFIFALFFCKNFVKADSDIFQYIPQKSDFALLVHTDVLFSHPALTRICQAGDIERLKKDLSMIPWQLPSGKKLPDVIYTFYSESGNYGLLLNAGCNIDEMEKKLQAKYAKRKDMQVRRGKQNGIPAICLTHIRDENDKRNYFIAYVSETAVVYTNYKNRMQWDALRGPFSLETGDALKRLKATDVASGYSANPEKISFDPTGILRRVLKLKFGFTSLGTDGISFSGSCLCANSNPEDIGRISKQLKSLTQVLLVFFFSADQKLFRSLNQNFIVTQDGNNVVFRSDLSSETVRAIRQYYENHENEMKQGMQNKFGTK